MKFFVVIITLFTLISLSTQSSSAQITTPSDDATRAASEAATQATQSAKEKKEGEDDNKDVTQPEKDKEKKEVLTSLFEKRKVDQLNATNFVPFAVQYAARTGVPTRTIILILLLPVLATIIVAFRYIVGLSGIGLLVPIALSITLLATGVTPGLIMLATILIASFMSRFVLKKIRIMQMPKTSLSMLMVSVFLLATLTFSSIYGIIDVRNLSIFPVLLLILLSDRIVTLFLERDLEEAIQTTAITLFLGILGFLLLSWEQLRTFVLLYPELMLLLIPINIIIGRYFGLRILEYIKFQPILKHGNK
jgi:hypothetical protein